ncbi:prepilin-type N-terminal cleavage/methylation domain-containing protein [Thiobacillus sedimenti]|uniref:Prepilin-type N-terminal cleavage/methylation domain-containing protein n=1 Tax=Thiobacillus sedimenti TaxID=3110231 RepID=A0ABZ1CKW9_9PROT|nr:prepilin-type N-terminal cleavage/methylation domain-containing protein [Thiobacillus sp. SCUT-2]WRS39859.1 prepilin-type N-terminal cleavage/methylation domain-containing protein [Thiobacillus sp. SCUT-2]
MPHPHFARRQSGFTLIEIAIVLVIIGLLLGGILKGQELINSARVKNLATDFRNVPVFIYGYQDKFRALPGDDNAAQTHVGASATNGDGDGIIGGNWDDAPNGASSSNSVLFWQHVRMAGLAPGATDLTASTFQQRNAVGGIVGIQSTAPFTGMNGTYFICSGSILGKYAKQLDTQLDDGNTATGSLMVGTVTSPAGAPVATASIVDSTAYTVCMGV